MSLGLLAPAISINVPSPKLNISTASRSSSSPSRVAISRHCYVSNGDSWSITCTGNSYSYKQQQQQQHDSKYNFSNSNFNNLICRAAAAAEYKFPDPIPDFADAETEKFKAHLLKKLPKKDIYGDSIAEIVGICTEIFNTFLHTEYGGPGTLMVEPFIDMADTLNERALPGGPQAARSAIKWAQVHVDKDWKEWTGDECYDNPERKESFKCLVFTRPICIVKLGNCRESGS